jgi:hypothetical protein
MKTYKTRQTASTDENIKYVTIHVFMKKKGRFSLDMMQLQHYTTMNILKSVIVLYMYMKPIVLPTGLNPALPFSLHR